MKQIYTLIGVLALAGTLMLFGLKQADAKDAPLFVVGKTYGVMLGCFPIPQTPCYGEKIKILNVRSDGWIEGYDLNNGAAWTYNPAQIISFIELTETVKAE